jgi:branched-chain amino acid transport system ATP-binding protein
VSTLLAVEHLTKDFRGLRALNDVTLEIAADRVTAIIGPNGAGKSTFFNAATGNIKTSSGKVFFRSRDVTNKQPHIIARQGLSRSFQIPRIFHTLTVLENAMLGSRYVFGEQILQALVRRRKMRQADQGLRDRALQSLRQVGLESVADRNAGSLGYAERKMVEIARALTAESDLLLLDEPFSGIHDEVASRIIGVIRALPSSGRGVCLIEHNMRIVMSIADHVYVLDHGELLAQGDPGSIRRDERVIEAYLGKGQGNECA